MAELDPWESEPEDLTWAKALVQGGQNLPSSTIKAGGEIVDAVMNPIETGHTLLKLMQGSFHLILPDEIQQRFDPEGKTEESQAMARAVGQYFKDKYKDILVIIGYIVRVDGSFIQKERDIVYEYLKKLDSSDFLDDESMKRIMKEYGIVSYQTFQARVRGLGENIPFDLIKFTEKIIGTQKSVSDAEEKALKYLKKRFQPEIKPKDEKPKIKLEPLDKECPHCHSKNITRKGKREYKNHSSFRYQCRDCNKIFSEKIEQK